MHNGYNPATSEQGNENDPSSVDDLINSGMKQAMDRRRLSHQEEESKPATPAAPAEPNVKKEKTAKDTGKKPTRLVYSDNETSPEEKLALRPKYAFKRHDTPPTVLGPVEAAVTGVQQGPDDVRDMVQN